LKKKLFEGEGGGGGLEPGHPWFWGSVMGQRGGDGGVCAGGRAPAPGNRARGENFRGGGGMGELFPTPWFFFERGGPFPPRRGKGVGGPNSRGLKKKKKTKNNRINNGGGGPKKGRFPGKKGGLQQKKN